MPPKYSSQSLPTDAEIKKLGVRSIAEFFSKEPPRAAPVQRRGRPAKKKRALVDNGPTAASPSPAAAAAAAHTAVQTTLAADTMLLLPPPIVPSPDPPIVFGPHPRPHAPAPPPKIPRISWKKGEPAERMRAAVEAWLGRDKVPLACGSKNVLQYATQVGIPFTTLNAYVLSDLDKRRSMMKVIDGFGAHTSSSCTRPWSSTRAPISCLSKRRGTRRKCAR